MDTLSQLRPSLARLAMIIQNLPLLLVPTREADFEKRILDLFRRYFTACNFLSDVDRAHAAWQSLHRSGQRNVLEDHKSALDYMSTVIYRALRSCETMHSGKRGKLLTEPLWPPFDAACECASARLAAPLRAADSAHRT